MNLDKRRNCKFLKTYNFNSTKIQAVVGFNKYYTCPLSLIQDSDEVFQVIQLIDWMDNSHIPITGSCILDQSPLTLFYRSIILSERDIIDKEVEAMTPAKAQNKTPVAPHRVRPVIKRR